MNGKYKKDAKTMMIGYVAVISLLSFLRAAGINYKDYQKNEDAFFPIRRIKVGKIGRIIGITPIIRERTIWECGEILLNCIVYYVVVALKKQSGSTDFLLSREFICWDVFTTFQLLIWEIVVFLHIKVCISKKKQRIKIPVSPDDKNIFELEKEALSVPFISTGFSTENMYKLNAYIPIYCLRDKGDYYRVAYFDKLIANTICIHYYDKSGNEMFKACFFSPRNRKEQFVQLKSGTLYSQVCEMDPGGCYEGVPRNAKGKKSLHCSSDGFFIEIYYDYDNQIQEIVYELI